MPRPVRPASLALLEPVRAREGLAVDLCDLRWGEQRRQAHPVGRVGEDWAVVATSSLPRPDRLVPEITTFVRNPDGSWRCDDERHDRVLVDVSEVPRLPAEHGVEAQVRAPSGDESLPGGNGGDRRPAAGLTARTGRDAGLEGCEADLSPRGWWANPRAATIPPHAGRRVPARPGPTRS